jgi:cyclopropane fatty-acyl-phospholipid synthase-like methyltransferase
MQAWVEATADSILALQPREVLEIGCGTGEHAVYFAEAMPGLSWLPTDPDGASRASTASWIRFKALTNVLLPLPLDASAATWDVETLAPFDAVVSINMVHIAPGQLTVHADRGGPMKAKATCPAARRPRGHQITQQALHFE